MSIGDIGIIGLGLVGGSIAAACQRAGAHVRAYDTNPQHLRLGLERGIVGATSAVLRDVVDDADIVVVATPVSDIPAILKQVDALGSNQGLLIDTGSVKVSIVRVMEHLRAGRSTIGGHPIAGKEAAGPSASDADLLIGRPFILTPTSQTDEHTIERARAFVRLIGMEPVVMDAERHDAVLARTSHLPQLLSTALALTIDREDLNLAGPGFRDMSRLARSNARVWRDILFANEKNVASAVNRFVNELQSLLMAIEHRDGLALTQSMDRGRAAAELAHSGRTL